MIDHQAMHVITIANSIIGVSILAMPYCFKQCGIILSIVILIVASIISRLSCHLLLKSAIMARRRTFEFLAFHAFGPLGKFIIEIGLIGFLLGTCIAFFVVMGDLAPAIVAKMTGTRATDTLRTSILMALALFCVLPLGLLRNIDSLSSVCLATIGFYFCLVLKIVAESTFHIFSNDWVSKVELWRPAGILQCLPIFSMALFCQTQIFEIYQAIPNASLEKMNNLIRLAVNICTGVYVFVGVFGYIAFSGQAFSGNILMSFPTSLMSEVMKIGFVLSVAFSFPLIIFPCRASLYSLLYKRTYSLHEGADKYIPEGRFKALTFLIVLVSLVTGVMIPSIELVLGLVGSTIGIMICVLFPAMCFICISTKNTNERILAQLMLFIGVIVMVLGTYANLYAMEEITMNPPAPFTDKPFIPQQPAILKLVQEDPALKVIDVPKTTKAPPPKLEEVPEGDSLKEIRHEPPQPEAPADVPVVPQVLDPPKPDGNSVEQAVKEANPKDSNLEKPIEQPVKESLNLQQSINQQAKEVNQLDDLPAAAVVPVDVEVDVNVGRDKIVPVPPNKLDVAKPEPVEAINVEKADNIRNKKAEEVDIEAIKKEDTELLEQEKEKLKEEEKKNLVLIKNLEKQNQESKKLLEEIKLRQEELKQDTQQKEIDQVKKEKLKAVQQIERIAKQAIEVIIDDQPNKPSQNLDKEPPAPLKQLNQEPIPPKESVPLNSVDLNINLKPRSLDEKPKEAEQKIGLNTRNLPPLPIALYNNSNMSEVYKNLAGKNMDVPKVERSVAKEVGDTKLLPVKSEMQGEKREAETGNKEQQLNLFKVLRTQAEKVTILNQEKQIQHREIRSVRLSKESGEQKVVGESDEGCDKDDKILVESKNGQTGSTEAPLIRMITRLSEPELVSIKLPELDALNADGILKPFKRDLKSYKSRKR